MADKAIVNSKVTTLNAIQPLTQTAADLAGAQKFVYTPTGKDGKLCFVIANAVAFAVTTSIAAGSRVFGSAAKADTGRATAGTDILQIETGKYMQANGTIELTVTPYSGKGLTADHALTVGVIELQ